MERDWKSPSEPRGQKEDEMRSRKTPNEGRGVRLEERLTLRLRLPKIDGAESFARFGGCKIRISRTCSGIDEPSKWDAREAKQRSACPFK